MRIFLIFLLLPLKLFSQEIEGVWSGTIYNDTTHKYIPYEIAITENKGKLSGFSHTIFTGENNIQETGVKSLKIKKKGDKILIEDDVLIYNNYTTPPPKGVRQFSVLNLTSGASGEYLVGAFNTNRTKEYASATGTINLKKKEKITETKIIPKLDELNLSKSLSFLQPKTDEKNDVAIVSPVTKERQSSAQPTQQQKDVALLYKTKQEPPIVKIEKQENLIDIDQDTVGYKVDVVEMDVASTKKLKTKEAVKTPAITVKKTDSLSESKKQTVIIPEIKKPPVVEPKKDVAVVTVKEEKKQQLPVQKEKVTTAIVPSLLNKPDVITQSNKKETTVNTNAPVNKPIVVTAPKEKPKEQIIPQVVKPDVTTQSNKNDVVINQGSAVNKPAVITIPKEKPKEQAITQVTKPDVNNQSNKKDIVVNTNSLVNKPEVTIPKEKPKEVITQVPKPIQNSIASPPVISSEDLAKRKIETIRSVDIKSDSIVLTLYDNGEVDGDIVSVILNGKTIMSKQLLTTTALTKTIYITPDLGDSLQLIMYAENLGSIAPNTGLLIIKDGEESYQIRFSGDLQKNSAIILRRRVNSH